MVIYTQTCFTIFKTPYIICTFVAKFIYNEYIRPNFFYHTLVLQFPLVTPPPEPQEKFNNTFHPLQELPFLHNIIQRSTFICRSLEYNIEMLEKSHTETWIRIKTHIMSKLYHEELCR